MEYFKNQHSDLRGVHFEGRQYFVLRRKEPGLDFYYNVFEHSVPTGKAAHGHGQIASPDTLLHLASVEEQTVPEVEGVWMGLVSARFVDTFTEDTLATLPKPARVEGWYNFVRKAYADCYRAILEAYPESRLDVGYWAHGAFHLPAEEFEDAMDELSARYHETHLNPTWHWKLAGADVSRMRAGRQS